MMRKELWVQLRASDSVSSEWLIYHLLGFCSFIANPEVSGSCCEFFVSIIYNSLSMCTHLTEEESEAWQGQVTWSRFLGGSTWQI